MQAAIIFIIFSFALQKFLFEGKVNDNSGMLRPEKIMWSLVYVYVRMCALSFSGGRLHVTKIQRDCSVSLLEGFISHDKARIR